MSFDITALNTFRNVNLGSDNAIANLNGEGGVKKNKELGSAIGKLFRPSRTVANNNAIRTELLKSLGQAFGISGVLEKDGKVRFSAEFISKLEGILGRDVLKTGDFEIGADGSVTSGKPLTQRRITAIMNKAIVESRGQYDADVYRNKLSVIKASIDALPPSKSYDQERATRHFSAVEKLMNFMEHELDGLFDENWEYNPKKEQEENNFPYVMVSKLNGKFKQVPLKSIGMVTDYINQVTGQLFHINENIIGKGAGAHLSDLKDPPKEITAYLKRAMTEFVMTSIDTYLDCEKAGKTQEFLDLMSGSWPCIEGKTTGITEFRLTNLPLDDAGPAATHNNNQPLNQCIGREITALVNKGNPADTWQDVAAEVKKNLVGTIRPIDVPVKVSTGPGDDDYEWKFEPLLDSKGRQVVRAITEEDIDRLGEACIETING